MLLHAAKQEGLSYLIPLELKSQKSDMDGDTRFGVYPVGFGSCFGLIVLLYALIPPFKNGNGCSEPLYFRSM